MIYPKLLVCDFDNTLYDWVSYFVPSFYRMLDSAAALLEVNPDALIDDFRKVHRRFGDAEHPFALLETDVVKRQFSGMSREQIARRLDPAFYAFNRSRKETLSLYPRVHETLAAIKGRGIRIVGHTEARFLAVRDRVVRLDLGEFFAAIYCRERVESSHPGPPEITLNAPMPSLIELSHHQAKPSADVLLEICELEKTSPEQAAYVGDSLLKDVLMANRAGVHAIWAKYGAAASREDYQKLIRISHWTDADIEREQKLKEEGDAVRPDDILEHGFYELLAILSAPLSSDRN